jgi:hypothetical protein
MYAIGKSFHIANRMRKQFIIFLPVCPMSKKPGEAAL